MFKWLKRLFSGQRELRVNECEWLLVFIRGDSKERVELGTFVGTDVEAMDECYTRQINWFYDSGIRTPIWGQYGIEPITSQVTP